MKILIEGEIKIPSGMTHDDFLDLLTTFFAQQGWGFDGITDEVG